MAFETEVTAAIAHWGPSVGVTIPPAAVQAIIGHESSFGVKSVTAEAGGHYSYGPMMVLDTTAHGFGIADASLLKDPALGIWYGVAYFARMLKLAGGNVVKAIAMYNGGKVNADGSFTNPAYVTAVLSIYNRILRGASAAAPLALPLMLTALAVLLLLRRR